MGEVGVHGDHMVALGGSEARGQDLSVSATTGFHVPNTEFPSQVPQLATTWRPTQHDLRRGERQSQVLLKRGKQPPEVMLGPPGWDHDSEDGRHRGDSNTS